MVKVSQLFRSYFGIFYSTRVRRWRYLQIRRQLLENYSNVCNWHTNTFLAGYNKELESGIKAVLNWRMDLLSSVPLLPRQRYAVVLLISFFLMSLLLLNPI